MANFAALTIQNGRNRVQQAADTLLVGAGVDTASGALALSAAGTPGATVNPDGTVDLANLAGSGIRGAYASAAGKIHVPPVVYERQLATSASQTLGTALDTDITGALIVLPNDGTYRIFYSCRISVAMTGTFAMIRLFDALWGEVIPNSEVMVVKSGTAASVEATGTGEVEVTVSGGADIQLQARTNMAAEASVLSDLDGRTWIGFERI